MEPHPRSLRSVARLDLHELRWLGRPCVALAAILERSSADSDAESEAPSPAPASAARKQPPEVRSRSRSRENSSSSAAQRLAAHPRGPGGAEHRSDLTLRRQAARRHDPAPLGCVRCRLDPSKQTRASAQETHAILGGVLPVPYNGWPLTLRPRVILPRAASSSCVRWRRLGSSGAACGAAGDRRARDLCLV